MASNSVYNHRPMQPNSIPPTRSGTTSMSTPSIDPHAHSTPSIVPSQGPSQRPVATLERGAINGPGGGFSLVESLGVVTQEFELLRSELLRVKAQKDETEKQLEAQVSELNFITKALFDLEAEHGKIRQSYEDEIVRLRNEIRKAQQHASGHGPPSQASSHTGPPLSSQQPLAPQRPPSVAHGSRRTGADGVLSPRVGGISAGPMPVQSIPMGDHVKMRESPMTERERERERDGRLDRDREDGRLVDMREPKRMKSAQQPPTSVHSTRDLYHTGTPHQTPALPPHPGISNKPPISTTTPGPLSQYRFPGSAPSMSPRVTNHPHLQGSSPHPHNGGAVPYSGPGNGSRTPSALTPVPVMPSQANNWAGFQNLSVEHLSVMTLPPEWRVEGMGIGSGHEIHGVADDNRATPIEWFALYNPKAKRMLKPELAWTFAHNTVVCCVSFSSDGKYLATGCNRSAQIYDVRTGQKVCVVEDKTVPPEGDLYIRSVRFSPDNKFLATGAEDRKIRIWNIANKCIVNTFEGHSQEIYSLDFSSDGKYIVSGSGDKTMRIWNTVDNSVRLVEVIPEDSPASKYPNAVDSGLTSVSISPDGTLVAAGSLDTLIRIYSIHTGQLLARLRGHEDSVYSVAFIPDGRGVVSGSLDRGVKVWDVSAVVEKARIKRDRDMPEIPIDIDRSVKDFVGHKDFVLSVAVSNDSRWIVSGSKDRSVHFWDNTISSRMNQDAALQFILQGHKNSVISLDVNPNSGMIATGSGDNTARIWKYSPI